MKMNQRARKTGPRGSLTSRESIARAARSAVAVVSRVVLAVIARAVLDRLLR